MNTTILLAHAYGQSHVLELEPHTLPKLAKGMARIQVKASGINPIDARRMTGEFKHAALPKPLVQNSQALLQKLKKIKHNGKLAMKY